MKYCDFRGCEQTEVKTLYFGNGFPVEVIDNAAAMTAIVGAMLDRAADLGFGATIREPKVDDMGRGMIFASVDACAEHYALWGVDAARPTPPTDTERE